MLYMYINVKLSKADFRNYRFVPSIFDCLKHK